VSNDTNCNRYRPIDFAGVLLRDLQEATVKPIACQDRPLRKLPLFTPHAAEELALIESLKKEQVVFDAAAAVIHEGQSDAPRYTLLSGGAARFKTLSDGRRQILNFLLPGDFIGVQQTMSDITAHGVESLTEVALCACFGATPCGSCTGLRRRWASA
jgi:CRP/FNR family transcriptional regulator